MAKHYKPDREAYLMAADLLGVKPKETIMVAAHFGDLKSARGCGLRTGFIYSPDEHGPGGKTNKASAGEFDVVARDMLDIASQLGA